MSNRNISENLEYFVDNQGLHYQAPFVDITTTDTSSVQGTWDLNGTWTVNGQLITTGTVSSSNNIDVGVAPARILDTLWPKTVRYTITKALVANTPQIIDWTGLVTSQDSFLDPPSQAPSTSYMRPRPGTTTDWEFQNGGYYQAQFSAAATVTVTDANTLKYESEISEDNGVTWLRRQSQVSIKGAAGTPSVDGVGGNVMNVYAPQGAAIGLYRTRYTMTCTENKTVDITLEWILNGRD